MMGPSRYLIVNADDFGQSAGINEGIIECHERGIVTSASLIVFGRVASAAAQYARRHPALSVGLHVDLGEWRYSDGGWRQVYEVTNARGKEKLPAEVARQLARFEELMGGRPTHLDSHQHVHQEEPLRALMTEMAERLAVPLRGCSTSVRYCGEFYGQTRHGQSLTDAISVDSLVRVLRALAPGVTELGCHPATAPDIDSMYGPERLLEVSAICHPRVRETIVAEKIALRSFRDWQSGTDAVGVADAAVNAVHGHES